ncbi:uncharacterized protein LOC107645600 isoform X1 [Arachis ipaensis]|uniref:uncharacterized protein LOC107645600 isoform X1 n=2 Tax=Arachis ipaensis TaxID=130454 RepID=UPI0007AF8D32|nr:uncharacterized protein LOC107645600 isoform X1 [Arachis ipaensis]XP_016205142.1 uncharacterized protein LOC107645600 isoform X1 [Arachis ipaensis]XP_016205143.1 uncharacterized protein LOC107645600 isoform X1 [Arachis ipaensis]XP_016205144.1 uncharacterized protein LOC107645600 isoform X1 [Arachis ipaensis]XP_020959502.1 uncharacterized protein LOC107645600 isoform X1 [Arachis ipaensis]XP_020959503.1 uncharacterized protein LOC107645600 isoform X1 [Arachis ipaensis]XP_020959504.1 uncharac
MQLKMNHIKAPQSTLADRVGPMEDSQEIEEQVQEEVISDNGTEKKQETRDEMLSQHRPVCSLCLKIIPTRSKKESKNVVSCSGSSKVNAVLEFVLELQICGGDFICVLDPQWIYWHYSKRNLLLIATVTMMVFLNIKQH